MGQKEDVPSLRGSPRASQEAGLEEEAYICDDGAYIGGEGIAMTKRQESVHELSDGIGPHVHPAPSLHRSGSAMSQPVSLTAHLQFDHQPAWINAVGTALATATTFGFINSWGVFQDYYLEHQLRDSTESAVSWIGSLQLCCIYAVGLFSGRMFDAGYFRSLYIIGVFMCLLGLFMTSLATEYYQIFLAQGLCFGLGSGLIFPCVVALAGNWFRRYRVFAMGITAMGSSIGGIIYPIMLHKLFGRYSFGWTVRIIGFMDLGLFTVSGLLMWQRIMPANNPPWFDRTIFSDLPYLVFVGGCFFALLGLYAPFFFVQEYAQQHGVTGSYSFYLLAVLNAAGIFGRTLPNILSDIIGPINILAPSTFMCGIIMFCWMGADSAGGVTAYVIFYGFFAGAYVSLVSPSLAQFALNRSQVGRRVGIGFVVSAVSSLIGQPIGGALLGNRNRASSTHQNWPAMISFSGAALIVASIIISISRLMLTGIKLHAKA